MKKGVVLIHRILFSVNVVTLAASLVFFLIKWNDLPAEIGMHFDGDGNFNEFASKIYGFYPQVFGWLMTAGIALADHVIKKKDSGLKISEKGEMLFRSELLLTLDILLFIPTVIFSDWTYSVAVQQPLNAALVRSTMNIDLTIILISIIIQIMTCLKHRIRNDDTPGSNLFHRVSRLTAWLLAAGTVAALAESWDRHPCDEKLYYDPDYNGLAYFANFGSYLDKRLLLIPHALMIILLTVTEIISVKAGKKHNDRLVSLTDKLKLIFGLFFFWWNTQLDMEISIGMISAGLFVLLCTVSFVTYAIKKKAEKK
ncbi:Protein of unknown function [Ruminococcus sp. YE71]|uniref:DUF1648 domain-containing protein n=1 Tax=unclassified Ruminococcus TaxID=2608920 RepID=UPI00087EAEDD|nr:MULTISPECIES: DUF1648 domain-containing protein [unclassified Ruminococcus]SDA19611.1 Protein of unknown function [Ruminococcus sp. YE78]SFW31064.1 Protein of unknown function [Ruminococcus sp. YE71]